MIFINGMIDITRCPLTLIRTKTHIILSNMKSYENKKKGLFYVKYPNSGLGTFLDVGEAERIVFSTFQFVSNAGFGTLYTPAALINRLALRP